MGIRGLFTCIQTHYKFCLNWHKLHDCTLVIDGNNLAYEIFNNSPGLNTIFGGDYNVYAHHVEFFLNSLLQCNVKPYIIMDGGHPVNREKFRTVFSRMNKQTCLCIKANPKRQEELFPVFGLGVFISVVQKLGLPILQADFEADDEIVVVAKYLNAYVLSNDSDFYLFDVPFILLNSVNFSHIQIDHEEEENYHFIPCYIFNAKQFCKITGIQQQYLPILAPLLGNDFVSVSTMQRFYDKISSLRPRRRMPHQRKVIMSVIRWLVQQKRSSPVKILEKVSRIICHRVEAKKKILLSAFTMYFPSHSHLKRWVVSHSSSCPAFVKDQCLPLSHHPNAVPLNPSNPVPKQLQIALTCTCQDRFQSDIISGYALPNWLLHVFRLAYTPCFISDLINKKYLFIHPQVEVSSKKSIYVKLAPLVRVIKGLLWNMIFQSFEIQEPSPDRSLQEQNLHILLPQKGFFSSLIYNHGRGTLLYTDRLKEFYGHFQDDNQSLAEKRSCSRMKTPFIGNSSLSSLEDVPELDIVIANDEYHAFKQYSSPLPLNNNVTSKEEESLFFGEKKVTMTNQIKKNCPNYLSSDIITMKDNIREDSSADSLESDEKEKLEICPSQEISMVPFSGLLSEDDAISDDDIQIDIATENDDIKAGDDRDKSEGTDATDSASTETDSEGSRSDDNVNYEVFFKDDLEMKNSSDKAAAMENNERYDNLKRSKHVATVDFENVKKTKNIPYTRWFIRNGDCMSYLDLESQPIENYRILPSLFTLHQLSHLERKNLFLSLLKLKPKFCEKIPLTLEYIFICIAYWWTTYEDFVDIPTLSSFLVSILMFYVIDGKLDRKPSNWTESFEEKKQIVYQRVRSNTYEDPSSMSIEELIDDLTLDECSFANYSLRVFHTMSPRETVRTFSRKTVHAFSEYQASMLFLKSLNSLLYFPFPDISVDSFWSGTFCYNIKRCFSLHENLKVVLSCIFENNNRIIHLFERFYSVLQSIITIPNIPNNVPVNTIALRNKLGLRRVPTITYKMRTKKKKEPLELTTDSIENPTEDDVELMCENKFAAFLFS